MKELERIKYCIENFTAEQYAEIMMEEERETFSLTIMNMKTGSVKKTKPEYYEYMKATWGNENSTIESCIERSRISKLDEYAKYIHLYTGFIRNGGVFVLNKEEKFVSFIYEIKEKLAMLYTHYNPSKADCIEESINSKYLFNNMLKNKYDFSKDENAMIKQCDLLLSHKN